MTRRSPKSQLANYQSPCVTRAPTTTGQGQVRHYRSWNEYSFHDIAGHVLRLSRSVRVRRQGLEPRTRGLRVARWAAAEALPARITHLDAPEAPDTRASGRCSFHDPFHGVGAENLVHIMRPGGIR
jgi:hypothetical protein